jgi:hypothetical protein
VDLDDPVNANPKQSEDDSGNILARDPTPLRLGGSWRLRCCARRRCVPTQPLPLRPLRPLFRAQVLRVPLAELRAFLDGEAAAGSSVIAYLYGVACGLSMR